MAFRCVNSGGDGGFKFFCERDEDDQRQTDPNILKIGAFSLSPAQFYLHAGAAVDIYVSFTPEREGQTTENLILACDNNTSESFQVTGNGAMLDVEIVEVDGRPINFKLNPFSSLQFPNTNPTAIT
jgi:D-Tyr-tRNAtyr deacylase